MSEIKKAIVTFHYTEKIKSELIMTSSLLEILSSMRNEEVIGAEKLLIAYLNVLTQEINIARNVSGAQDFQQVALKLEKATKHVEQHNYADAIKIVSEAISLTTTSGNKAAETLKEKNLI